MAAAFPYQERSGFFLLKTVAKSAQGRFWCKNAAGLRTNSMGLRTFAQNRPAKTPVLTGLKADLLGIKTRLKHNCHSLADGAGGSDERYLWK
jgi:hypothetical protein